MNKALKIVTIGGGSSYTPELIEGFIQQYNELPVSEIWLVDIEAGKEKLNVIGDLARRMITDAGLPIKVMTTLNRKKALKNADFVITQIRVGFLEARAKDERIPLKHGVIGQETNGAGGFFKGLRTIPVILDVCREMESLCPDAWLINFTNPAGMVTEAVLRYSNIDKVIGLCNIPIGIEKGLANLLEVNHSRLFIDWAGLNHMVYGLNVYLDGESIKEEVIELITKPENSSFFNNVPGLGWQKSFLKSLNAIPCPYHAYYYKQKDIQEEEVNRAESEKGTRAEVVQALEDDLFKLYSDPVLKIKPPQLDERGGAYYSEGAVRLISSLYNDKKDIQPVNVRNNGAIYGISDDSAVEVNCLITKEGPKPIHVGELPVAINGLIQQIKSFERIAVKAAITGSYDLAVLALTINPLVASDRIAKNIVDDMLQAHKEYLPQFSKVK